MQPSAKYLRRSAKLAMLSKRGSETVIHTAPVKATGFAKIPATSGPCRNEMQGAPTDWHGRNARADWFVRSGNVVNLRAKYDVAEQDVKLRELMNDRELATREYAAILERLNG